ncbi:MAG: serine hydrolase domain-containing protein [Pyrinomonadaceae bacterium]
MDRLTALPAVAALAVSICCLDAIGQSASADRFKARRADAMVREKMAEHRIPGASLAVLRKGRIIHSRGYGFANLEHRIPALVKTNYLIASLTKMFTASAVLMLADEGRFTLEDRIDKHVPGLPEPWRPVTIRQLLNHTTGIIYPMESPFPCKVDGNPLQYTREMVIAETGCLPLKFQPGTKYEYSGRGYYVLGLLIERVSGRSFGAFLHERIFTPLGMNDTNMIDNKRIVPNRASGHVWKNGSFFHSEPMEAVIELSDGGIMSTVLDLAKWDAALYTDKPIKRTIREQMWANGRLNDGTPITRYGMGFELSDHKGRKRVGHSGLIPGFSASFERFSDGNITVILLTNSEQANYNTVPYLGREIALVYIADWVVP